MIPTGQCECGCGSPTRIALRTQNLYNLIKGQPLRFIHGHNSRGPNGPGWKGGRRRDEKGYIRLTLPDHPNASKDGWVYEHVYVASRALGNPLPPGAVVHHINGDKGDNRPENLVVLNDPAHHAIVERRTRALRECGNADFRKCVGCKQYDDPAAMKRKGASTFVHAECRRALRRRVRPQTPRAA